MATGTRARALASNFVDLNLVYGDEVRLKQERCMNQIVLIEEKSLGRIRDKSVFVTFGDGTEKEIRKTEFDIRNRKELSIIFINNGLETIQNKGHAQFSEHEAVKDSFIYTLGVVRKFCFDDNGVQHYDPAVPCFTGGNVSFMDVKYKKMDAFFHNCTLGDIAVPGSVVLNESCEIIGINFHSLSDSTVSFTLREIKYQIAGMFRGMTQKMTFADIRKHLDARAQGP